MKSATTNSAISVVNAIGTGYGGAIGIDLRCRVKATLEQKRSNNSPTIITKAGEQDKHDLIPKCASYVERFLSIKIPEERKLVIEVDSKIPVGVGLKSSSAISTAVVSAVAQLLGDRKIDSKSVLEISCKASKASRASITGAYDDAVSCLLGGFALTDNQRFRVLRHSPVPEELGTIAVLRIPQGPKVYTSTIRREWYSHHMKAAMDSFELARQGNVMGAMMLNSLVQCSALNYSFEPIMSAVLEGATSSGISGKGPAVAALCTTSKIANRVEKRWKEESHYPRGRSRQIKTIRAYVVQPKEILSA